MRDKIRVTTDRFEHRQVKPHFINSCCFGEDFATWLLNEIKPLQAAGFEFTGPIQEDYGWGVWARLGKDLFWIALSYCGDGPTDEPAEWIVSVAHDPAPSPIKRFFHKADARAFEQLRDYVWQSLKVHPTININT